jgi:hypothetical protein
MFPREPAAHHNIHDAIMYRCRQTRACSCNEARCKTSGIGQASTTTHARTHAGTHERTHAQSQAHTHTHAHGHAKTRTCAVHTGAPAHVHVLPSPTSDLTARGGRVHSRGPCNGLKRLSASRCLTVTQGRVIRSLSRNRNVLIPSGS